MLKLKATTHPIAPSSIKGTIQTFPGSWINKNTNPANNDPQQSTTVPPGGSGYSIDLDEDYDVLCITSGMTFEASQSHTVCWWANTNVIKNGQEQFGQFTKYDTYVWGLGGDYKWKSMPTSSIWDELVIV